MLKPTCIDFETEGIESRPAYPPKPVGFSIKTPADKKARYYAWGHPEGNNCDRMTARQVLRDAVRSGDPLLFHNAKFDTDVMEEHFQLKVQSWDLVHDTMFLVALTDPHAFTFSLKPSAERILGMAPTERDAVRDWIMKNVPGAKKGNWGAHISKAPGDLVGKYADGDVSRTLRLFRKLHPDVRRAGMEAAYNRERELMPILLENERRGIRVDLASLERDEAVYTKALTKVDTWIAKQLGVKGLDVGNDQEVAEALATSGMVTEFVLTKTGKRSVSKDNLTVDLFRDERVAQAFLYRNKLATCLSTFFRPWLEMGTAGKGSLFMNWNQVRQSRGGGSATAGARTGRMSANGFNPMNIPKNFDDKNDGYKHPKHLNVPELPLMRRYILPDKGQAFCHRDYNQQELRILAHFENGDLMRAYQNDPRLDVHTFVQNEIERISGAHLERRAVKILNFGMIYGMGLGALARDLGCSVDEAKEVKSAQRAAMPNLVAMERSIRKMGDNGEGVITWGGRVYYAEPPAIVDGHMRTFSYKLLNYLVQGSAADCTKQAIINYHGIKKTGRFLATVHDEINISCPKSAVKSEMKLLREAMADVAFDVPMISDGKSGPTWGELTKLKED